MFISFVASSIKQFQQKQGLSFEKCKQLVYEIAQSDLLNKSIEGIEYVYNKSIIENAIKRQDEIEPLIGYLSTIPVSEKTKHFKPLVKMAIEDIFNYIESPVAINKLTEYVYPLFDQRSFHIMDTFMETFPNEPDAEAILKHKNAIMKLLSGLSKEDAGLISEYLFQKYGKTSLSEMALKYKIPKSSVHQIIDTFRKKIITVYFPENEEDGISFIQKIETALDKLSN